MPVHWQQRSLVECRNYGNVYFNTLFHSFLSSATEISRFVLVNSNGRLHQVPLSVQYKTDITIPGEGNQDIFAFDVDVKHR